MRSDPLIIHLYDKPHPRRVTTGRHSAPSGSAGPAVLACAAIAAGVAVFFWGYAALVHRETNFVPVVARDVAGTPRKASAAAILIPPQAPAPDLHSPAIALANADVPPAQAEPQGSAAKGQDHAVSEKAKKAAAPPKKTRVHTAKRLPPEAAQSYAAEPGFFRVPLAGF